jgi:hypothetical protein
MSAWRPTEDHERLHIDSGPRINALHFISEALDIPRSERQNHPREVGPNVSLEPAVTYSADIPQQQDDEDSSLAGSPPEGPAFPGRHLLNNHPHQNFSSETPYNTPAGMLNGGSNITTKTIVAADGDVSNGFVMSGRSLPYVFEASESGIRKRSSKILPVCAVCSKRFVCVTTMKRHLVTHTGEKPFSCKVCGKQYTQKGNLRVHERTHRNDRPFECNICHQKFYRKEPMQKHQWRQHGVVHFKTRPNNCSESSTTSNTPTPDIQNTCGPPIASTSSGITIHQQPQQVVTVSSLASTLASSLPATPLSIEQPNPLIALRPAKPSSYTALVDSLRAINRETSPYRSDPPPIAPPAAHQTQIDVPKFTNASSSAPAPVQLQSLIPQQLRDPQLQPPVVVVKLPLPEQLEFKHAKCRPVSTITSESSSRNSSITPSSGMSSSSGSPPLSSNFISNPPVAHNPASLATIAPAPQSNRQHQQTIISINNETAHQLSANQEQESASNFSYSSILNETPNTHLLNVPAATTIEPVLVSSQQNSSSQSSTSDRGPIKLKMKMAYQAYQAQEQQQHQQQQQLEEQEQEQEQVHAEQHHEHEQQHEHQVVQNLDNDLNEMKLEANEMVECQCKTCGNIFSVTDPYNFRCTNCNVKYTSLPTHLIGDPLQCIGCCTIFPHKPALKAHQTVSDKERPFRCCKCGYGFRQKAHLQKHQWRIHRRRLEPDPNMKEAEAFFEVIRSSSGSSTAVTASPNSSNVVAPSTTITMQDIINKSVEKSIGEGPRNLMKTSSKYYSEVLGLEYEPKSSTSSDDDDSRDQPLDLSPAKKLASRENNPLLNQPPLPPNVSSQQTSSSNVNNSIQSSMIPVVVSEIKPEQQLVVEPQTSNHDQYPGTWKKAKTSSLSITHSTLPPISGLQKPMSLVTVKNPYKHSSWISPSMQDEVLLTLFSLG